MSRRSNASFSEEGALEFLDGYVLEHDLEAEDERRRRESLAPQRLLPLKVMCVQALSRLDPRSTSRAAWSQYKCLGEVKIVRTLLL